MFSKFEKKKRTKEESQKKKQGKITQYNNNKNKSLKRLDQRVKWAIFNFFFSSFVQFSCSGKLRKLHYVTTPPPFFFLSFLSYWLFSFIRYWLFLFPFPLFVFTRRQKLKQKHKKLLVLPVWRKKYVKSVFLLSF